MKWIILIISMIVFFIALLQVVKVSLLLDVKNRKYLARGIILIILWVVLHFTFAFYDKFQCLSN